MADIKKDKQQLRRKLFSLVGISLGVSLIYVSCWKMGEYRLIVIALSPAVWVIAYVEYLIVKTKLEIFERLKEDASTEVAGEA